ncbi:MAG: DUF4430 domain-containing protein [Clostridia bacterium]|nr:DUF4430 domain-containing protein [Clostridia bacterium]
MNKKKIVVFSVLAVAFLAFVFWWGGNAPGLRGFNISNEIKEMEYQETEEKDLTTEADDKEILLDKNTEKNEETEVSPENYEDNTEAVKTEKIEKQKEENKESPKIKEEKKEKEPEAEPEVQEVITEEVKAEEVNVPEENEEEIVILPEEIAESEEYVIDEAAECSDTTAVLEETERFCTISVRCDTVFNHGDLIDAAILESLPANGVVLMPMQVEFYDGESVFDVLARTLRSNNIHMEFTNTPMYKSAYIEGIANLYEFDCGELSGWMYKVNGIFPDYGSSLYEVKNGDIIEWVYTCDKGKDVGDRVE